MKKLCLFLLSAVLFLGLCACGRDEVAENTTENLADPPPYTTVIDGKTMTARKMYRDKDNYEIGYYDESGTGERVEYYKDGKLSYYYISEGSPMDGSVVQKYYYADGTFFAKTYNDGFIDAKGNAISEDEMEKLIP